jgi:hypothetical protein
MNKNIIIVSGLNREILPAGENWLVIGPFCYGKSRSLPIALENAAMNVSYGGGQFTARVIPDGELFIENDGAYYVKDWTAEQKERANTSTRIVAITKSAATRWGGEANIDLKNHRKNLPVS